MLHSQILLQEAVATAVVALVRQIVLTVAHPRLAAITDIIHPHLIALLAVLLTATLFHQVARLRLCLCLLACLLAILACPIALYLHRSALSFTPWRNVNNFSSSSFRSSRCHKDTSDSGPPPAPKYFLNRNISIFFRSLERVECWHWEWAFCEQVE